VIQSRSRRGWHQPQNANSQLNRQAVRDIALRHRVSSVRVFGAVVHGDDTETSDLDLLVDPLPGVTLFDLGAIQVELEAMLKISVDVVTPGDLPARFRAQTINGAVPV
jgi:predicted nucleotidyltransferase